MNRICFTGQFALVHPYGGIMTFSQSMKTFFTKITPKQKIISFWHLPNKMRIHKKAYDGILYSA
jgi:hypothetical protein